MALFLKAGEGMFHSQPVRFRLKQLLKDSSLYANKINVSELIMLFPRESAILKSDPSSLPQQWPEFIKLLNANFEHYAQ